MEQKTAYIACGCYWGVQYYFDKAPGIIDTEAGFMGGPEENPTYDQVKHHLTGHAETVRITYDPTLTTYEDICKLFFEIHDFTQTDGIGTDIGPQYRSELFYLDDTQKKIAGKIISQLSEKGYKVSTSLTPASTFWPAHMDHQHYFDHHEGEPDCHIRIKIF